MAAIQKIRSHGTILMIILGGALLLFIVSSVITNFNIFSNANEVGSVNGKSLDAQTYQRRVEILSEELKTRNTMQSGKETALSDQEMSTVRNYVWQEFSTSQVIKKEAGKAGLSVSDEELDDVLRTGQAQCIQLFWPLVAQFGLGDQYNFQALKQFIGEKDKNMQQIAQSGNADAMNKYAMAIEAWDLVEKDFLPNEILLQKLNTLMSMSVVSDPISAKYDAARLSDAIDAQIVAIPASTIDDAKIQVSEAELQAAYDELKEMFYQNDETRDVKIIDVNVVPSPQDMASLKKDMEGSAQQLATATDINNVIGTASTIQYTNMPLAKAFFQSEVPDVAQRLDSGATGSVVAPYISKERDGSDVYTTFKVVAKEELPDSILYSVIVPRGKDLDSQKKSADSIYKAIAGGADWAALSKKYNQQGAKSDSIWMTSKMYERFGMSAEEVKINTTLNTTPAGEFTKIEGDGGDMIVKILDRKAMQTKYNVAIYRRNVEFSDKTSDTEQSKLNEFLAKNQSIDAIVKNAPKSGYKVQDYDALSKSGVVNLVAGIGNARDVATWIFDDAEAGEVSKVYEVGSKNDHLVLAMVTGVNKKGYLPIDNPGVRKQLTAYVKQQKKVQQLAKNYGKMSFEQASAVAGAVTDTIANVNAFAIYQGGVMAQKVGTPEVKLAAAICKTAVSKTAVVEGTGALYFVKVLTKKTTKHTDAFAQLIGANIAQSMLVGGQQGGSPLLTALIEKTKMDNNLYKFF